MATAAKQTKRLGCILSALFFITIGVSCSRPLGWGVLLWSAENPAIPSGTVLPVLIQSNIDRVWVVSIPKEFQNPDDPLDKFEVPLWQLELAGGKGAARRRAEEFAPLALTYAETIQDGLPIREDPDNSSRRVYRLRMGQIVKVLTQVEGNPAISTTGDPLPGEWYRVLTEDGSTGYCFSYRLKMFEHTGGPLLAGPAAVESLEDPDLDLVLSKNWSPDFYGTMVSSRRINLEELEKRWHFSPGLDTGMARIYLPAVDRTFTYTGIRPDGVRSWFFDGAPLQMSLYADNSTLAVRYTEEGGASKTALFVSLPADVEDLIDQEIERRETLFQNLLSQGSVFTSANYGTLSFFEDQTFTWSGSGLLIPQVIPAAALDRGAVVMDLFLSSALESRYSGAFSLAFDMLAAANTAGGESSQGIVHFMYTADDQGIRLEYVSRDDIDGSTVIRRSASPTVLYFFKSGI